MCLHVKMLRIGAEGKGKLWKIMARAKVGVGEDVGS